MTVSRPVFRPESSSGVALILGLNSTRENEMLGPVVAFPSLLKRKPALLIAGAE